MSHRRWIPVEEALPEEAKNVTINIRYEDTDESNTIHHDCYRVGNDWVMENGVFTCECPEKVTHWREYSPRPHEEVGEGWIPVERNKPPRAYEPHTFGRVLVRVPDYGKEEYVGIGYYLHDLDEWRVSGSPSSWGVTHWQPLPEGLSE